ncbi:hypothetical protein EZV62_008658 [Acer yangbiense]|uniref:Glabrous enhancer-binding protein-like DBD domain-containing protein n=1 Tax=Acer yangbiense TaxID=1000413 RepID=A0A5C7IDK6_9ROSI|nr:hypothetical protein EZV62_008658 [Acer yangbiense]
MATAIGEKQLQTHDDDEQSKEEDDKKENPDGDELLQMKNDVYIQIRLLRGVLDYYQHNKLYPHDHNPNSLPDFFNNWLRDNFLTGDFRELIHNLREKFQSGEVSERKVEEKKKKKQDQIQILACMIEYYISEQSYPLQEFQHYKVFYKKWLHLDRYSSKVFLITIYGLKMEYKNLAGKNKVKDLVFSSIEDLLFFNLSDIIWGSDQGELSSVEDDMKFLAAMIDYYYIRKWRNNPQVEEEVKGTAVCTVAYAKSQNLSTTLIFDLIISALEAESTHLVKLEAASCTSLQKLLINVRILKLKAVSLPAPACNSSPISTYHL